MDCQKVRQQILSGGGDHQDVRLHLRNCAECAAFRQRLEKAETLIESSLPFEVAAALTQRLQGLVPRATQELRASSRAWAVSAREVLARRVLYGFLILTVPLSVVLGLYLWREGSALVGPWVEWIEAFLPLLPAALFYWGGRLIQFLAPIREALLFVLSFLLLGLSLERALRSARLRPAAGNSVPR